MDSNGIKKKKIQFNKSVNPVVVIFLSLILLIGCGFGGWYLGTQYASQEATKLNDSKDNKKEEKDTSKPEKNTNYSFAKERSNEVNYTNEKTENVYNVVAYYYIDKENLEDTEENKKDYYVVRREVFVNNKVLTDVLVLDAVESEEEATKVVNEDDLDIVKPLKDSENDDVYLVINLEDHEGLVRDGSIGFMDYESVDSYIVDKTGITLKKLHVFDYIFGIKGIFVNEDEIEDRTSYTFKEVYGEENDESDFYEMYGLTKEEIQYLVYTDNNCVDIHDSYIYYIDLEDCEVVKEYKLTISKGVISEINVKSYSGNKVQGAGQC